MKRCLLVSTGRTTSLSPFCHADPGESGFTVLAMKARCLDMINLPFTRQAWLGVLARASAQTLASCLDDAPPLPDYNRLRGPEIGMSMVRGRAGGGGNAFNLGEMTVARCSVRDAAGRVGHGYAAGRDLAHVERIARLDAALQDATLYPAYEQVLIKLAQAEQTRRDTLAAKAAATDVQFLTLSVMR